MKITRKEQIGLSLVLIMFAAYIVFLTNMYIENQQYSLQQKITELENQLINLNDSLTHVKDQNKQLNNINEQLNDEITDLLARIDRLNGVEVPAPQKTIYLTFDDGPSAHTIPILNILKKYNVPATFFVNGRESDTALALYQRIIDEGHVLGNHTYSHDYDKIYKDVDSFMQDVYKLDDLIYKATGITTKLLRFPGGTSNSLTSRSRINSITRRALSEGYQYFDWNVDSLDGQLKQPTVTEMVDHIVNGVKYRKASIVLMHDLASKRITLQALPLIIEKLSALGYTFDKLDINSYYVHHR